MTTRLYLISVSAGVLAFWSVSAYGQYDRLPGGRANDASLRVGSGGYNLPRRSSVQSYANEIVSGNVRGGRQFRGDSPISSTTDFSGALGTTELDGFRRDSIGVDDINSGYRTYMTRPYYSGSRTVTSVGGVSVGFRPDGVRQLPSSYINLPSDPLGARSSGARSYSRQIPISSQDERPGYSPSGTYERSIEPVTRSALFGIAPDPARSLFESAERQGKLGSPEAVPHSRLRSEEEVGASGKQVPTAAAAPATPKDPRSTAPEGSALDRLLRPASGSGTDAGDLPGAGPSDRQETPTDRYGRTLVPRPEETKTGSSIQRTYGEKPLEQMTERERAELAKRASRQSDGGDVYRTMLRAASALREIVPSDRTEPEAKPVVRGGRSAGQAESAEQPLEGQESRRPAGSRNLDDIESLLDRPIVTFSGTDKTFSNEAFKQAEERLKAGRYYDAVTSYDIARSADLSNPLVWIGRGHALIGAGDYLSAVRSLEEGLGRFPQYGRFRIDLKAFLDHKGILDVRRADLEQRLEKKDNYRLRFLLGYIEYFSGLEKFGLPNLEKAAAMAPSTSPIAKFPQMLGKK
ncbi:MAG: hypothetical protein JXQ73_03465 [Phycisphaerae bacterium]|nr:hypothetical protein [Phycisphaerae bacterium]